MVADVERKLLLISWSLKVTTPLTVARVADALRMAVDEASPYTVSEPLLVIVSPPFIWEMVADVERKLLETNPSEKVVTPPTVAKVAEVERKLLFVSSPLIREIVADVDRRLLAVVSPVKESVPLMVDKVADEVLNAVDDTSPVPRILKTVEELTWKLMKSPLKGVLGLAAMKVPEADPDWSR